MKIKLKDKKTILISGFILLCGFLGLIIYVISKPTLIQAKLGNSTPTTCSNYINPSSLALLLVSDKVSYDRTDPMLIRGVVTNNSSQTLKNVTIRGSLVYRGSDETTMNMRSVDNFVILESQDIPQGKNIDISYAYSLLTAIDSGKYTIELYADTDEGYDLSGNLSLNANKQSSIDIDINSELQGNVYIDTKNILVSGAQYTGDTSRPQVYKKGSETEILIPIQNTTSSEKSGNIEYDLYKLNDNKADNKINSQEESIIIPANKKIVTKYSFSGDIDNSSLYIMKIRSSFSDNQYVSYTTLRFDTEDSQTAKISYLNISPKNDGNVEIITCLQNSNLNTMEGYTLTTTLLDNKGTQLSQNIYAQDIPVNKRALAIDLEGKINTGARLDVILTNNSGDIVDKANFEYTCDTNNTICNQGNRVDNKVIMIFISILIIIAGGYYLLKKNK